MNLRKLTKVFILIALIIIIAYDIYVYVKDGGDATISRVLLNWSQDWPPVSFSFFFLMGHLFWPQKVYIKSDDYEGEKRKDSK